ncbi:MAG: hypothetical protein WEC15_04725 [Flavobacteriales bacterium]
MSELEFRPRFRFRTGLAPEVIKQRIQEWVRDNNPAQLRLGGTGHHLSLQFPHGVQRSWTPQMDIDVELEQLPDEKPVSIVRCQIGPMPTVWMLFVGGYIFLVVIALLGISMGASQQVVGAFAWGWWVALPTPFLAVVLWLVAQEGQRRSKAEMGLLKHFVDDALGCDCFALAEAG